MLSLGEFTVLGYVIHRAWNVQGVDEVVVATTTRDVDDAIVSYCDVLGVPYARGETDDLLERYVRAADLFDATHILRVTADCPLLDPGLNSRILDACKTTWASYVSISTRSNGLVQEAFTREALERAYWNASSPEDLEHVVPWMIRNEKTLFLRSELELGTGRYCVDTMEDLERLRALYEFEPALFDLDAARLVDLERMAA